MFPPAHEYGYFPTMEVAAAATMSPAPEGVSLTQHAYPLGPGQRPVFTVPLQELVGMQVPRPLSQGRFLQQTYPLGPGHLPVTVVPLHSLDCMQRPVPSQGMLVQHWMSALPGQ